jgi:hypothetical protein
VGDIPHLAVALCSGPSRLRDTAYHRIVITSVTIQHDLAHLHGSLPNGPYRVPAVLTALWVIPYETLRVQFSVTDPELFLAVMVIG